MMRRAVLRYRLTVGVILTVMYLGGLIGLGLAHDALVAPHDIAGRALVVVLLLVLTAVELLASAIVVFGLHRLMLGGRGRARTA